MLQATDLGLGTTWVGHFDPSQIINEFLLPDHIVPVALLPLDTLRKMQRRVHFIANESHLKIQYYTTAFNERQSKYRDRD